MCAYINDYNGYHKTGTFVFIHLLHKSWTGFVAILTIFLNSLIAKQLSVSAFLEQLLGIHLLSVCLVLFCWLKNIKLDCVPWKYNQQLVRAGGVLLGDVTSFRTCLSGYIVSN